MNTEELNALKDRAHKAAVEHGFHEEDKSDVYWLGLVISDMGKAIDAVQKGLHADTKGFEEDLANIPFVNGVKDIKVSFVLHIKNSLEDELSDIVIRLLDFAGMKGYELCVDRDNCPTWHDPLRTFYKSGLPGLFFIFMDDLSDAFDDGALNLGACIYDIIDFFCDCFGMITGSDKDLWYFVEKKMEYNEQRPKLNGKK